MRCRALPRRVEELCRGRETARLAQHASTILKVTMVVENAAVANKPQVPHWVEVTSGKRGIGEEGLFWVC